VDNYLVIEPRLIGNTVIYIRTTDDFTGYSLLDSIRIFVQDTANISSLEDAGNEKNSEILLYPNPTQDKIFINLAATAEPALACSIMDCAGNAIKVVPLTYLHGNKLFQVETSYLTPGYYFLRIFLASGSFSTLHFIRL
jgi:hypothetical protein